MTTINRSSSSSSDNDDGVCNIGQLLPRLTLPNPICSNIPGTWAYDTMSRRIDDEILQRVYDDNSGFLIANIDILYSFQKLRDELRAASFTKLTMLPELSSQNNASHERREEWRVWQNILQPYITSEDTWLSAPWMITEFYVYRKLMECLGYWTINSPGYNHDPFNEQKRTGLISSVGSAGPILGRLLSLTTITTSDDTIGGEKTAEVGGIAIAASIALWGNKMDLSLWPANIDNTDKDIFTNVLNSASTNLLHDDLPTLSRYCETVLRTKNNGGGGNVYIIVDNAGFELITDLALGQYLLCSGIAHCITYCLKSHPTFVSDALEKDLLDHVEYYANLDEKLYPQSKQCGTLWKEYLSNGRFVCKEDNFWVQPLAMWDMPSPLHDEFVTQCDLAFVKGDANYRRLLGDRQWQLTDTFEDVVGYYFPCPVCALRTFKAEIGCGLEREQIDKARKLDSNWMVNGRFGVVQFSQGMDR